MDCLFCKIAQGEIPAKKLYEDDKIMAFYDIEPQAPVHFLVIPRKHIDGLSQIEQNNADIIAHVFVVIAQLTRKLNLTDGYRVVANCGVQGGQTVQHLHFHVLGGRDLQWPPG